MHAGDNASTGQPQSVGIIPIDRREHQPTNVALPQPKKGAAARLAMAKRLEETASLREKLQRTTGQLVPKMPFIKAVLEWSGTGMDDLPVTIAWDGSGRQDMLGTGVSCAVRPRYRRPVNMQQICEIDCLFGVWVVRKPLEEMVCEGVPA